MMPLTTTADSVLNGTVIINGQTIVVRPPTNKLRYTMQTLIKLIKRKHNKKAYSHFETEVDLDECITFINAYRTTGEDELADTLQGMIDRYNEIETDEETDEVEVEVAVKKVKPRVKAKPKTGTYPPYAANGGLNILGWAADLVEGYEFDHLTMMNSNYRLPRDASKETMAQYLVSLWYDTIDLCVDGDDDSKAYWLTRIVRQQLGQTVCGYTIPKAQPIELFGVEIDTPAAYGTMKKD